MFVGDKLVAKVPLSWKQPFSSGIVIPHKVRYCTDCSEYVLCDNCYKLVDQTKEFSANLCDLKTQPLN